MKNILHWYWKFKYMSYITGNLSCPSLGISEVINNLHWREATLCLFKLFHLQQQNEFHRRFKNQTNTILFKIIINILYNITAKYSIKRNNLYTII